MRREVDFYSYSGSRMLAGLIERYWHARGFPTIKVERFEIPGAPALFGLRSNIGPNGFPPA